MRSAIGRPLDVRFPSNLYAIGAALASGGVGLLTELIRGDLSVVESFGSGAAAGGSAFLGWAIAREIDPDRNATAYLAAPIGLAIWFFGAPALLVSGAVLLMARVVAGTTGGRLITADLVFLAGYAVITGLRPGGVVAAVGLGVALIVDCRISHHDSVRQYAAGAVAVVGSIVAAVVWADPVEFTSLSAGAAVVAVVAAAAVFTPIGQVSSVGDMTRKLLDPRRILGARLATAVVVAAMIAVAGEDGSFAMGPVLAALVALPLSWAYTRSGRPIRTSTPGE